MNKLSFIMLLVSNYFFAQINFEKGYFIDNNNTKKECLIKNEDWKYNPVSIKYKENENGEIKTQTINNIKEFAINDLKFERFEVLIDTSSHFINSLSRKRDPEWSKKTVFLKNILDSKIKLYQYDDTSIYRFFYALENSLPQQLISKEFTIDGVEVKQNEFYKQQLWNDIKCNSITKNKINALDYNKKNLIKFFKEANECIGGPLVTVKTETTKKTSYNIKLLGGLNSSTYKTNDFYGGSMKFGAKTTYSIGIEMEYFLPFNKNKWSLFLSPIYKSTYKQKTTDNPSGYDREWWAMKYSSIDFNLGGSHHFYLNQKVNLSIKGGITQSQVLTSSFNDNTGGVKLKTQPSTSLLLGMGFSYKKTKVEFLYNSRSIIEPNLFKKDHFNSISINLAYTIFSKN